MLEDIININECGHMQSSLYHAMSRAQPTDYLIVWVLSGHGRVFMGSQEHIAQAGDLLILRPNISHTYYADPDQPWEINWVHLIGQAVPLFAKSIAPNNKLWVKLGLDPLLRDRFNEIIVAHHSQAPGTEQLAQALMYAWLGRADYQIKIQSLANEPQQLIDVHRLQQYIHQHLTEPIALDDLADLACMSTSHFSRQFKQLFNESPIQYIIRLRIGRAAQLLSETAMPIKQICREVGYDDQYYFSRLFKKTTDTSPSDYRRNCRLKQQ